MIRSFSYTFGADETGLQTGRYSGGTAHFADISYAVDAGKMLQVVHGEEKLGCPSTYSTCIYQTETNTLLVYTRCMPQFKSGRTTSCGQVIVYNMINILNGENYMSAVFGTEFLSEEEILKSETVTEKNHDKIVRPRPDYAPVDLAALPEERKKTIAAAVSRLMNGKQAVLRLPVGKNYEAQSLEVLQQIMTLVPQRDRCEITFATACKASDIKNLRRINLILTDMEETVGLTDGYIDLDAPRELDETEEKWYRWCTEAADIRADVEYSSFFDEKGHTAEIPRRSLQRDCAYLESLYEKAANWWKDAPEPRFETLNQFRKELRDNPTLSVKHHRAEFLSSSKLQQLIAEPKDLAAVLERYPWVSGETRAFYRNNRLTFLLNDAAWGGEKVRSVFDGKTREKQKWSSPYYEGLIKELTEPFYTDLKNGIVAEGQVNGVSFKDIVRDIIERIENYRNI